MKHRRYGHGRQAPLRRRQTRAASLSGAWASLAGRLKGESWASLRAGRPTQDRLRRASPVSPLCPPRVSCVSYVPLCLLYGPCVPCLLCVSSVSLVRVTTRRRRCEESDAAVPQYYPILRCRGTHRCPSRVVRRNDRLRRSGDSRKTTRSWRRWLPWMPCRWGRVQGRCVGPFARVSPVRRLCVCLGFRPLRRPRRGLRLAWRLLPGSGC